MASPAAELRQMDYDELASRLGETRKELFNLRFQLVTGQLDNSARLGQVRKEVARIATILREKEIEAAEAGTVPSEPTPTDATPTEPTSTETRESENA